MLLAKADNYAPINQVKRKSTKIKGLANDSEIEILLT
jgi:hypothetical protein